MGEAVMRSAVPAQASERLTRGLASLFSRTLPVEAGAPARRQFMEIPLAQIRPNAYQPRREFDAEGLRDLAASIRESGVLQPVVVRRSDQGFELIAGERRLRAAKEAGLDVVPAIIRDVSEDEMLALALVENVQRDDLNAMELARAYAALVKRFGLKQEEVASRLGVSRPAVANTVRLLELPAEVQEMVSKGTLTAGHARAVLSVEGDQARASLAREIVERGLSVREAEALAQTPRAAAEGKVPSAERERPAHLKALEARLSERLGTKVVIVEGRRKGRIVIEFYSNDDFERIMGVVGAAA